jgi:hypothetical protein
VFCTVWHQDEGHDSAYTRSEATSAAGSYSQLDAPTAGSARPTVPAVSRVENSWDASFATAQSSTTPSKDPSSSSLSASTNTTKSSAAKKPMGFAIPALNMSSLPVRVSDAEDIPSYRSTGRDLSQYLPGNSSRQSARSDWDADASQSATSPSRGVVPPVVPPVAPPAVRTPLPVPALNISSATVTSFAPSASGVSSVVIGASEEQPTADVSTLGAGSASDTSVSGSADITASSNSYLTISSASPHKAQVPAPAVSSAALSSSAPSSSVPTSSTLSSVAAAAKADLSAKASIKYVLTPVATSTCALTYAFLLQIYCRERLKNRLSKNRNSDTVSVASSASAADEVMSFDD